MCCLLLENLNFAVLVEWYIKQFCVFHHLIQDRNTSEELNTGIHVASVSNVDKAELLLFFGLLDHHRIDIFDLAGFF